MHATVYRSAALADMVEDAESGISEQEFHKLLMRLTEAAPTRSPDLGDVHATCGIPAH